MCGICAIVISENGDEKDDAQSQVCKMLQLLRHRGYDSWGVSEMTQILDHRIMVQRGTGVPQIDVTKKRPQFRFVMGHTRYTTQGSHDNLDDSQPLFNAFKTIALVHNGQVETTDRSVSDTRYILNLLRQEFGDLHDDHTSEDIDPEDTDESAIHLFEERFHRIMSTLKGSYACVAQIVGLGMFAFRDPRGIRPLAFQRLPTKICFASESCAFESSTAPIEYVAPGEVIWVNLVGEVTRLHPYVDPIVSPTPCLFEFIYLAHDDSCIDGIRVSAAREEMGRLLVDKVKNSGLTVDIIIPIPHTPVLAGRVLARCLGVEFVEALEVVSQKVRRESRTFILPTQTARENAVETKFFVKPKTIEQCRGRRVLLLDDSIVRGTTLRHVVKLIRAAIQPSELYVASLAPPIISPNYFGIDIPSKNDLIAGSTTRIPEDYQHVPTVVQNKIGGIDAPVIFQDLTVLKAGLKLLSNGGVSDFEDSVFRLSIGEILGYQF